MKVRANYVSNSSSSSYIIWGKGASDFIFNIDSGESLTTMAFANTFFWHSIMSYWSRDKKAKFIEDDKWKELFKGTYEEHSEHAASFNNTLPSSIYSDELGQLCANYNELFIAWFTENFSDRVFYEIEFSDHEGETRYSEEDMHDVMASWNGAEMIINNH